VWLELCQAAFDAALEGFSRARKCSIEGRSNMSLDVQALQYGLDAIHACRPPRGVHYVESYIKAGYMPEEAMLQWVRENWPAYAYRHLRGLLQSTLGSVLGNKRLRDAIAILDELYGEVEPGTGRLAGLLATRLLEERKITNLLPKGMRKR
jgi:hypothetical protein